MRSALGRREIGERGARTRKWRDEGKALKERIGRTWERRKGRMDGGWKER